LAFLRELCLWELSLLPLLFLHKILSAVEPQEIKTNLILLSIHYFCEIVNKTCSNKNTLELAWWYMPVIQALGKLRQEDQ
jgi:hypothetical protein